MLKKVGIFVVISLVSLAAIYGVFEGYRKLKENFELVSNTTPTSLETFVITFSPSPSPKSTVAGVSTTQTKPSNPSASTDDNKLKIMVDLGKKIGERYSALAVYVKLASDANKEALKCLDEGHPEDTCKVFINLSNSYTSSINSAEGDIEKWEKELRDIALDCPSCMPAYEEFMKMFEGFKAQIKTLIK